MYGLRIFQQGLYTSTTNRAFSVQNACGLSATPTLLVLMRLRMLKLSAGKGRQAIKQLYRRVLQYYATVATERAGYVLYRALVVYVLRKEIITRT